MSYAMSRRQHCHVCSFSNSVSYSHLPCHVDVIYDTKMRPPAPQQQPPQLPLRRAPPPPISWMDAAPAGVVVVVSSSK